MSIKDHVFSDSYIFEAEFIEGTGLVLDLEPDCSIIILDKPDAIALAKHFNVTAEDLI
jgi:hypothetical protein